MYPTTKDASLIEQLAAEAALSDLVEVALDLWLPLAEAAVDVSPADPTAAADKDAQWDYLVEGLVLYGIGILAADSYIRAYTALADEPLPLESLRAAGRGLPWSRISMPGMPTVAELHQRAATKLRRRTNVDPGAVEATLAATPTLSEFVRTHLGNVRDRVLDAARRVFQRSNEAVEAAPSDPDLAPIFDPLDPEWASAAEMVGQSQATSALNAGTVGAAEQLAADRQRGLDLQWVAIIDDVTREAHAEANGQRTPTGSTFDVGGEDMRYPGDPLASLENTINCRCRMFAFFSDEVGLIAGAAATMAEDTQEEPKMGQYRSFTSVLAVIGEETDDGRMFAEDIDLTFRDFPLPLLWQKQSEPGHYSSFTVGVIESSSVSGSQVIGAGYMLDTPEAGEAMTEIEHKVTGPSVDLGSVDWELRDGDGNPISDEDYWDLPMDAKIIQTVLAAKLLAATLVSTPAFGQTSITLGELVDRGQESVTAALVAAAVRETSTSPSVSAFANPNFTEPTLPHMTEQGTIRGHLASWNVCHVGIQDACVLAPHSQTDYTWFHTSPPVKTAEGEQVKVGRLTVGGGHAGPRMGIAPAIQHYDDVGTCFALVHVGEDEHGIWFSGIPAPGATEDDLAKGLAAPLSGDWRAVSGNLELVAALSVNTPGFPIIASGATDDDDRPLSLIASLGPCRDAAEGSGGLSEDQLRVFARVILAEQAAEAARNAEALALLAADRQREALALIEGEN